MLIIISNSALAAGSYSKGHQSTYNSTYGGNSSSGVYQQKSDSSSQGEHNYQTILTAEQMYSRPVEKGFEFNASASLGKLILSNPSAPKKSAPPKPKKFPSPPCELYSGKVEYYSGPHCPDNLLPSLR